MKTDNGKNLSASAGVRLHAEKQLQSKTLPLHPTRAEGEMPRRGHELETHRNEPEMRNAKLRQTRDKVEAFGISTEGKPVITLLYVEDDDQTQELVIQTLRLSFPRITLLLAKNGQEPLARQRARAGKCHRAGDYYVSGDHTTRVGPF